MATNDSPLQIAALRSLSLELGQGGGGGSWVEGQPPTVDAVSGTFTAGQTATITVGNMSAKRNGQLAFITFTGQTVGQKVTGIAQDAGTPGYIATSGGLFGGTFAECNVVQQSLNTAALVFAQGYDELFFEGWAYLETPDYDSLGDEQIKLFRLVPGSTLGESAQARNPQLNIIEQNGLTIGADPDQNEGIWYGPAMPRNQWLPWSMYSRLGTSGVADGERYVKIGGINNFTFSGFPGGHFASPDGSVAPSEWRGSPVVARGSNFEGLLQRVFMPYYTRDDQSTISRIDRLFCNDSPERVVVGDAATFTACTPEKRFVLKQNSRSGNQIEVEVDSVGPLATGPVYLYVFNRDGLYNSNGYLWRAS